MFLRSYLPRSYVPRSPMLLRSYVPGCSLIPKSFVLRSYVPRAMCFQDPASDMQSVGFCVSLSCRFELLLLCISIAFQCSSLKESCLCCCSSAWGICVCSFTLTASSQSCFVLQFAPQVPTSWQIIPSSVCGAAWRLSWWLIMNVGTGDSQQCREEGKKKGKTFLPFAALRGMYSSVDSRPVGSVVVNNSQLEGEKRGVKRGVMTGTPGEQWEPRVSV